MISHNKDREQNERWNPIWILELENVQSQFHPASKRSKANSDQIIIRNSQDFTL